MDDDTDDQSSQKETFAEGAISEDLDFEEIPIENLPV